MSQPELHSKTMFLTHKTKQKQNVNAMSGDFLVFPGFGGSDRISLCEKPRIPGRKEM